MNSDSTEGLMTLSDVQWEEWLKALEHLLHEADAHGETIFAIHINSAIETAYSRMGRTRSKTDFSQLFKAAQDS